VTQYDKNIARARLALRAERAFGLNSVKIQLVSQDGPLQAAPPSRVASENTARDLFAAPPITAVVDAKSASEKLALLKTLDEEQVRGCVKCRLCEQRTQTVFGEGDADARIMFIGEGPGENEDLQGRPFVGRAGEMLNKWIAAMGLRREQVYIANIVKCRPPGNREPALDEVETCTPYLVRQIEIIQPRVIVTLGRPAMQYMLQTKISMGKMRGQWQEWRGVKLLPTYHPAYVLRNYVDETRKAVWSDLQLVMKEVGLRLPARKGNE
jgi:DNA polymerase